MLRYRKKFARTIDAMLHTFYLDEVSFGSLILIREKHEERREKQNWVSMR